MIEAVKYHNDFNKIKLPNFTELEQNILMGIVAKIKERQSRERITFTPKELMAFSTKNITKKSLAEIIDSFEHKFFKADFKILLKNGDLIGEARVNLFNEFIIWKYDLERCGDKANGRIGELEKIELSVNPKFAYLAYELTKNFTRFELAEFIALRGKYTKTLYRLLKQYRETGWVEFELNEFKRILDIPDCYRQIDIDQQILKPAIKSLSKYFENLKYTKIKKGGNKVTAIRFVWENVEKSTSGVCARTPNLQAYCGMILKIKTKGGFVEGKIANIYWLGGKIIMEIRSENLETTNFTFNDFDELEKCVNTFKI